MSYKTTNVMYKIYMSEIKKIRKLFKGFELEDNSKQRNI